MVGEVVAVLAVPAASEVNERWPLKIWSSPLQTVSVERAKLTTNFFDATPLSFATVFETFSFAPRATVVAWGEIADTRRSGADTCIVPAVHRALFVSLLSEIALAPSA